MDIKYRTSAGWRTAFFENATPTEEIIDGLATLGCIDVQGSGATLKLTLDDTNNIKGVLSVKTRPGVRR